MIPACFSQPSTLSSNTSHEVPQNLITCIFQTQLGGSPTYLTLIWSKTLFSHSLTIHATDFFSITVSLHPSTFSFFLVIFSTNQPKPMSGEARTADTNGPYVPCNGMQQVPLPAQKKWISIIVFVTFTLNTLINALVDPPASF